jgi:hypothetical protein
MAVAGALTAAGGLGQAATTPGWRITATLRANATFDDLAATGVGSAWAAGSVCTNASCSKNTLLIRHWNGKAWTAVSVPKAYVNSSAEQGESAVAAASGSAWIMNPIQTTALSSPTAVLHWTGKGWGATVRLPGQVMAAVAPSATNVWAFGAVLTATSVIGTPYAAHYDGKKWSPVRVPVPALHASATSASDIWAIGLSGGSTTRPALAIMHFNGKTWRTTPAPNLGLSSQQDAIPTGIAAVSAANVWAEGLILGSSSQKPFLLHWNGKKWAAIKVPYSGQAAGSLARDGHGGIWMGVVALGSGAPGEYLAHYRNGTWTRVTVPARRGYITMPVTLAWIPGTRSLWGLGEELPTGAAGVPAPVILKYGA